MIKEIWQNRLKIAQGVLTYLKSIIVPGRAQRIARNRISICESNRCGYYDKDGYSEMAFIKGKPACGICGCNIKLLAHSMDSKCSLHEIGKEPLWNEEKL